MMIDYTSLESNYNLFLQFTSIIFSLSFHSGSCRPLSFGIGQTGLIYFFRNPIGEAIQPAKAHVTTMPLWIPRENQRPSAELGV
jgi:hypothetical protein